MTEERFFRIYMSTFLAGVLFLLPLSPLCGYVARKVADTYELDRVAGIYIATAPHLLFFLFMGTWLLISYWKYKA